VTFPEIWLAIPDRTILDPLGDGYVWNHSAGIKPSIGGVGRPNPVPQLGVGDVLGDDVSGDVPKEKIARISGRDCTMKRG
jgi:hypothetical protein